jgi:excisionase family DNA binding protein
MSREESNELISTEEHNEDQIDGAYGLPPILNAEQAAGFLGVNVKTLYKAVANGEMPGRKIGNRTVILRDALLDWLRTQERVRTRRGRSRR